MKLNKVTNWILLLIFITIFTFLGAGKAFDHKISHNSPTGFMASDAFTHNWVAQNTFDTNYVDKLPEYAFSNREEYEEKVNNYVLFHPSVLPLSTASIAKLSKLNVYDVNILLVFIFIVLIILLNYFILARFNETLALFSLPLILLFLQRKFFISLSWGWWDFMIGEFFLFAVIFLILTPWFKHRYLINGLLIILAFMSHGMEAGYAAIFIAFYLLYSLIFNRKEFFLLLIEQIKSLAVVILIGLYSINIFLKGMGALGYHQVRFMSNAEFLAKAYGGVPANYFIFFEEFLFFKIIIILGSLILLYLLIKKKSQVSAYCTFVIFMSFLPYLYIMAGERGFQWRFLWPIYLSFSLGAVCFLIFYLIKKWIPYILPLKISIFSICSIGIIMMAYPLPFNGAGVLDADDYASYTWIHKNTDVYSDFLILFSPVNDQISRLYLVKRHIFISTLDSWQSLNVKNSSIFNLKDNTPLDLSFCEKDDCSLFKESHFLEKVKKQGEVYFKNQSICFFDYIYLNLKNQQEIQNKNAYYITNLISKNISQIIFNNNGAVILKNIVKGEECERRFRS